MHMSELFDALAKGILESRLIEWHVAENGQNYFMVAHCRLNYCGCFVYLDCAINALSGLVRYCKGNQTVPFARMLVKKKVRSIARLFLTPFLRASGF